MVGPINSKVCLGVFVMLLLTLVMGPGCEEAKPPPSPKAVTFSREVQSVINRIAPAMAGPITQEDREAVQGGLVKAFSVCAKEDQGFFHNVFILDQKGVLTAVYPPAEVEHLQFSNYKAVKRAFAEKKPDQTVLYQPDGTPTYIIYVPLVLKGQAVGILALVFEGNQIREKWGLSEHEFLSLDFQSP